MKALRKLWLVASISFLAACACHGGAGDSGSSNDAALDAASSDIGHDAQTSDSTSDVVPDISGTDATGAIPPLVEFDASPWQEPNPCEGTITPSEPHDTFAMPDRPPDADPVRTRETIISNVGGVPLRGRLILASAALQPGSDTTYDLFAEPGTDVTLHFYVLNGKEDLSSFRLNLGVVLDYKPVEATYVRWNADRSQKLFEQSATGVNFPVESDVEIIDVTIPAAAFDESRMYEVSMFSQFTSDEYTSDGDTRRLALYYGGYKQAEHPCFEPQLDAELTQLESDWRNRTGHSGLGMLFFEGLREGQYLSEVIDVEPGETRDLYLSLVRSTVPDGPKPTVAVATINGEPFLPAWWLTQGGDTLSAYFTKIDARKRFEVTFPTEPGIYEVQVITWLDPMRLWRNRNGVEIQGVARRGRLHDSSNPLRFRVVDTESSP